jgi:hypothetical protein
MCFGHDVCTAVVLNKPLSVHVLMHKHSYHYIDTCMCGVHSSLQYCALSCYAITTGNAGTTILSATFLILAEEALSYVNGKKRLYPAASYFKTVNFGDQLGNRTVFRMNLIEAVSCNEVLKIPNIDT